MKKVLHCENLHHLGSSGTGAGGQAQQRRMHPSQPQCQARSDAGHRLPPSSINVAKAQAEAGGQHHREQRHKWTSRISDSGSRGKAHQ